MNLPSLKQHLPLALIVICAISAIGVTYNLFSAIHDHGYNKGVSEGKAELQQAHDATQQAIGEAKSKQQEIDDLNDELIQSYARTAQATKDVETAHALTKIAAEKYSKVSNKPVRVRPKGEGVSDAELIRDAKGMGLVIR